MVRLVRPAMEETFFDMPLYRDFAVLGEFPRLSEEFTVLRFCHRLERHKFAEQILTMVNE
jgi:IS5 family transposase